MLRKKHSHWQDIFPTRSEREKKNGRPGIGNFLGPHSSLQCLSHTYYSPMPINLPTQSIKSDATPPLTKMYVHTNSVRQILCVPLFLRKSFIYSHPYTHAYVSIICKAIHGTHTYTHTQCIERKRIISSLTNFFHRYSTNDCTQTHTRGIVSVDGSIILL